MQAVQAFMVTQKFPLSENDKQTNPISYYGATKLSNEVMAHSYSSLFKLPTTGLRFFTVYGPWDGRIWHYFCLLKQ